MRLVSLPWYLFSLYSDSVDSLLARRRILNVEDPAEPILDVGLLDRLLKGKPRCQPARAPRLNKGLIVAESGMVPFELQLKSVLVGNPERLWMYSQIREGALQPEGPPASELRPEVGTSHVEIGLSRVIQHEADGLPHVSSPGIDTPPPGDTLICKWS